MFLEKEIATNEILYLKISGLSQVWLPEGRGEEMPVLRESCSLTWRSLPSEESVSIGSSVNSVHEACILYSYVCFNATITVDFGLFSKPNIHVLQILLKMPLCSSCGCLDPQHTRLLAPLQARECSRGFSTSSLLGSQPRDTTTVQSRD